MAENPKDKQDTGGTPVAQDDVLGEAARATGPVEGLDAQVGADGTPRERSGERGRADDGAASPGKDENQAGFVKDREKKFSP
jgi:hypothetical protein